MQPLRPIAYQLAGWRVLCTPGCLTDQEAQEIVDAGGHAGDVHPWTVDLYPEDEDLRCGGCGRVLVRAPAVEED